VAWHSARAAHLRHVRHRLPGRGPTAHPAAPLWEIVHHERYEEDKARDLEAIQRFLWEASLLGGWRSSTGLDGRVEQPRE
jgi:hypothetical protein